MPLAIGKHNFITKNLLEKDVEKVNWNINSLVYICYTEQQMQPFASSTSKTLEIPKCCAWDVKQAAKQWWRNEKVPVEI